MSRDMEYENNNIGYDHHQYYGGFVGKGIKCKNLVDQVANNCTKEQSSRYICPSQDDDFYYEMGIPKSLYD